MKIVHELLKRTKKELSDAVLTAEIFIAGAYEK
jgi:hypothetical protein